MRSSFVLYGVVFQGGKIEKKNKKSRKHSVTSLVCEELGQRRDELV